MTGDRAADPKTRAPGAARRNAAIRQEDLSREAFALTSVSWTGSEEMGFEQWVLTGRRLGAVGRALGWWLGDWLRFGNARYGEKYAQAARITGYDTQTLMNMVYVASRIEPERRRETLSWSHHAEVAAMAPEEQRRWLDRAEESRLSVLDLRQLLRKSRRDAKPLKAVRPKSVRPTPVRPTPDAEHTPLCPECGRAFESAGGDDDAPGPRSLPRGGPGHPLDGDAADERADQAV